MRSKGVSRLGRWLFLAMLPAWGSSFASWFESCDFEATIDSIAPAAEPATVLLSVTVGDAVTTRGKAKGYTDCSGYVGLSLQIHFGLDEWPREAEPGDVIRFSRLVVDGIDDQGGVARRVRTSLHRLQRTAHGKRPAGPRLNGMRGERPAGSAMNAQSIFRSCACNLASETGAPAGKDIFRGV